MNCDYCGHPDCDYYADNSVGVEAWNLMHPNDIRTQVNFCSPICGILLGMRIGHEIAARADKAKTN